jgi:prephenate dehydratase
MDTAAAAAEVASRGDPSLAAIASAGAGELYGLDILRASIQDNPQNYTRFVTVAKNEILGDEVDKCSLQLQLEHVPGALADTLKHLADQGMNLTKIVSRPMLGSPFEYLFYIDIEFIGGNRRMLNDLCNQLGKRVTKSKILGFYKRGALWKV